MKIRADEILLFALVALTIAILVAMITQGSWPEAIGAFGFALITLSWIGMLLRLRREVPDHPLATTSLVLVPRWSRDRRKNFAALIGLHWERHRFDAWTALLTLGLVVMLAAFASTRVVR